MKFRIAVTGMALVAHAGAVIARSDTPPLGSNNVVVTATRTARTADQSLAAVDVITREDIERRQPQDLVDLLRTQAGIDLTRAGGPSGNVSLFMRGTNSNHVLVLVDGVRVASATTGAFEWRSLPIAQIERVEIVRGPRASLYGSDAIGGVIQIFTRRPEGAEAALTAGSHRTGEIQAAWGSTGSTRMFVTGNQRATQGFSAQNERGFAFDPDNDAMRQQSVSAGVETALGREARLEVRGWQSRGHADFDIGRSHLVNGGVNARLTQTVSPSWSHTLSVGAADDELDSVSVGASRFQTRRRMADWQNDIVLGAGLLTAGLSYVGDAGQNINVTSGTTIYDRNQSDRAAFALWQAEIGAQDLQIAGRHDDYSSFGGHNTGNLVLGRTFAPDTRGWISYGTAFRAPSLNDLYSPGSGGLFAGNPGLHPERSRTAEIGLRQRFSPDQHMMLALFSTRIDDLIAFEGAGFQAINVDKSSVRGAEIEHAVVLGQWQVTNALTLQRARNETTDKPLVLRPDKKLSTFIERNLGAGSVGAEIILSSDRRDVGGAELPGYGLVNLAGRHSLNRMLTLEGRLENLFDKKYQLIDGFNTPDRSIYVTLRYRL